MTPAGTLATAAAVQDEPRREEFRRQHQVRIVEAANEGFGVDQQPNGTYGFTYAPTAAAPLFAVRKFQNFEVHKASSGTKFLLGYVTPDEAKAVATLTPIDLKLYPESYDQATELVCLSLNDVSPRPQHSGQPGSPAPIRFEP